MQCGFFRVLVPSIVAQPDVVTVLNKLEGQTALFFAEADPDFAVHHQAVMQVDNFLLDAILAAVDLTILFALAAGETVHSQEVAIFCMDHMLFCVVTEQLTQIDKIISLCYRVDNGYFDLSV